MCHHGSQETFVKRKFKVTQHVGCVTQCLMKWAGSSEWGTDAGPRACRQVFSEAHQALPCHSTLPPIWSYHQWIHRRKYQMRHKDCYIEQDIMMLSLSQVWCYFSYTCCESNPGCIKVIPWISKAWMGKNSIASISCWTPLPGWELRCARGSFEIRKNGVAEVGETSLEVWFSRGWS